MNFSHFYFLREKQEGDRVGVQHLYSANKPELYSMSLDNFRYFVSLLAKNKGIISPSNSSVSEKVDGMALKVGNDERGFYVRSSYSGKGYDADHFKTTIKFPQAQAAFVNSFEKLKSLIYPLIKGNRCEIQLEWLYSPNALTTEDEGYVSFVVAKYKKQKLGTWSTFVVLNITGDVDNETLKNQLVSLSDEDVKFLLPNVNTFRPINLSKETQKALKALESIKKYEEQIKSLQGSLKRADVAARKQATSAMHSILLPIQKTMYEKIANNLIKTEGILGEIEGYVIKAGDLMFKVNNPQFMSAKFGL